MFYVYGASPDLASEASRINDNNLLGSSRCSLLSSKTFLLLVLGDPNLKHNMGFMDDEMSSTIGIYNRVHR
jgi:hypothetical protein